MRSLDDVVTVDERTLEVAEYGAFYLVPPFGPPVRINMVGQAIWQKLKEDRSVKVLVEWLSEVREIDVSVALQELMLFLESLCRSGIASIRTNERST